MTIFSMNPVAARVSPDVAAGVSPAVEGRRLAARKTCSHSTPNARRRARSFRRAGCPALRQAGGPPLRRP
jgi:hypothetical protein